MWLRQRRFLDTYSTNGCGCPDIFAGRRDLHFGAERNAVGHDDGRFYLLHDGQHHSNQRVQPVLQTDFGFVEADHQGDGDGGGL